MSKTVKFILWVVLFAVVLGAAYLAYNWLSSSYAPSAGSGLVSEQADQAQSSEGSGESSGQDSSAQSDPIPAFDFTVYTEQGDAVTLSSLTGERPVLLNFWASWCGPCKSEMPDLDRLYADYQDRVEFMMINLTDGSRETVDSASAFIRESGYGFPVYYDTDVSAAAAYSVYSIPTTFLIDAQGNLYGYAQGALTYEILSGALEEMLQ